MPSPPSSDSVLDLTATDSEAEDTFEEYDIEVEKEDGSIVILTFQIQPTNKDIMVETLEGDNVRQNETNHRLMRRWKKKIQHGMKGLGSAVLVAVRRVEGGSVGKKVKKQLPVEKGCDDASHSSGTTIVISNSEGEEGNTPTKHNKNKMEDELIVPKVNSSWLGQR
mmetsp:Transcript_3831/g.8448  ORF Transcript_3831/g.8448 Transcript_3831/m.8448 type:complete len:166 (+) Transcript_3831:51-548(+)|eukprot:CAMPEP_0183732856 /NCGR_PEP_ID=MMETSP0737-20130205/39534_1 /TAXON_ID=385413 /ORGANISM="Thalassiosira miniscula, Strain CCMP1093" /LENGTH=165 /DNA_ID=CAMNT_0025965977 /DNA_START=22 /DNA_END=519 /DNA_ORIENTATION=+